MIREEGEGEMQMHTDDSRNHEIPLVVPLSPTMNRQLLMPKDQMQSMFLTDSRIEETKWGVHYAGGGNLGGGANNTS